MACAIFAPGGRATLTNPAQTLKNPASGPDGLKDFKG